MRSDKGSCPQPDIPDLKPPREKTAETEERRPPRANRRGLFMLLVLAFIFFLILDAAILAYFLWPHREKSGVGSRDEPEQVLRQSSGSTPTGKRHPAAMPDPAMRQRAVAARERWLGAREEAEAAQVRLWAVGEFLRLLEKADQAGRALAANNPAQAADLFARAADGLRALLDSRPERFHQAMSEGDAALHQGRGDKARAAFTRALAIYPGDAGARKGISRAANLKQVLALYEKALQEEEKGRRADAITLLEEIRRLDPDYSEAAQALARISNDEQEERFGRAMAGFYQAMQAGNSSEAAGHLARAARIRPDSLPVAEGKRELALLRKQQQLTRLAGRLGTAEKGEQWQKVLEISGQMLRLDPDNALARQAGERAGKRKDLDQRLDRIMAHPERLAEEAVLAEAKEILAVAGAVGKPGPKLAEQVRRVEALVERAARPVAVRLRSDGATEVVIYRVGHLGRFVRKTVRLRPGRYTVVGSRPGFRDVRREILIRADRNEPLLIRCTEPI